MSSRAQDMPAGRARASARFDGERAWPLESLHMPAAESLAITGDASRIVLVVPCYDEAERLDTAAFRSFRLQSPRVSFCFVNDGSRDGTLAVLQRLCTETPGLGFVVDQQPNRGKAEAVRQGLLAALVTGAGLVGYWDADLATPLAEVERFCRVLDERPQVELVLGSRVRLLGRSIERSALRHYLGRVFATGASLTLRLPVYDTQCGAKLLRATPDVRSILAEPFLTRWVFDVELIARLARVARTSAVPVESRVWELPLRAWRDVPGSKVKPLDFVRSGLELVRIRRAYP
jgi:glycosyltransferase involved in cell wall biosynthesis